MNNVNDYLNKHRIPNKNWREYDNMKATLIGSMSGTVLFNREMYLWGKPITVILNPE